MRKRAALLLLSLLAAAAIITFNPVSAVSGDSWMTKAPMQQARAYLGVAVVNEKIYAIGGDTGSSMGNADPGTGHTSDVTSANEEYNLATNKWTPKAPMPNPRAGFGTAVYQDEIYCLGGWTNNYANTNANEAYNSVTDEWETKAQVPITGGSFVTANVVNGRIYVLFLFYDGPIEVYDIATDSWTNKTSPPNQVISRASAVVDTKLFFVARSYDSASSEMRYFIQIYDTVNDKWSIGAASPTNGLTATAAATTNLNAPSRIYVFEEKATYIYDPTKNSWTNGIAMPPLSGVRTITGNIAIRICASAAAVNDLIYVIGGRIGEVGYITDLFASNLNEQYTPVGYGTVHGTATPVDDVPPEIAVLSPQNKTYNTTELPLNFNVNESGSWIRYKLDTTTVVELDGNATITDLSPGSHSLTVYATDTAGNTGASETVYFTVAGAEASPTVFIVAALGVALAVVGIGILLSVWIRINKMKKATH